MAILWILLGLVCLLFLIGCIRVSAIASYDKEFHLTVKIACISIKPLEKKNKSKKKKKPKKEKKPSKKKKKERPKPSFDMIKSGVTTLLPVVLKTLQRLGKGVRFQPVQAYYCIPAGNDPAKASILYGKANALLWGVMPQLEAVGDFKDVGIAIDVDYQASEPVISCHVGIGITIGRALAIAAGLLVPAVQWYRAYTKEVTTVAETASGKDES